MSELLPYLLKLAAQDDRGSLAALRRGLAHPRAEAIEMHEHVMPHLPQGSRPWDTQCHYMLAALFASYPANARDGNMGTVFRRMADAGGGESVEKRFVALLKCHQEDLFDHLRHAVSLAKAKNVPIGWDRLLHDIRFWASDTGDTQRDWSRAFWGAAADGPANKHSEQPQPPSSGESA